MDNELDRIVEWAEDLCGVGHAAWDTIDPRLIASAILEAADNLTPQRTWVHATEWRGLTDDEMTECIVSICNTDDGTGDTRDLIRAVEAKLKEKNT